MDHKYRCFIISLVLTFLFVVNTPIARAKEQTQNTGNCVGLANPNSTFGAGSKDPAGNICLGQNRWQQPNGQIVVATLPTQITPTLQTIPSTTNMAQTGSRILPQECKWVEDGQTFVVSINGTVSVNKEDGSQVIYSCVWDDQVGAKMIRERKSLAVLEWEEKLTLIWLGVKIIGAVAMGLGVAAMVLLACVALFHEDFFRSVRQALSALPNWLMGGLIIGTVLSITGYIFQIPWPIHIPIWIMALIIVYYAKRKHDDDEAHHDHG